jgi:hypothetical protein
MKAGVPLVIERGEVRLFRLTLETGLWNLKPVTLTCTSDGEF